MPIPTMTLTELYEVAELAELDILGHFARRPDGALVFLDTHLRIVDPPTPQETP